MTSSIGGVHYRLAGLALALLSAASIAQESGAPLMHGGYVAPMASYVITADRFAADDGYGGLLGLGYRAGWWAAEAQGVHTTLSGPANGRDVRLRGFNLGVLLFPFDSMRGLFGSIAVGGLEVMDYPGLDAHSFETATAEAGLGYLFPVGLGRYDFAVRAEARYRAHRRDEEVVTGAEPEVARRFDDVLVNIGLQLPLGMRPPPSSPPERVPAVVSVLAVCADGADNDRDGVSDYPSDPGCLSADDADETDPPECSDGKDNDGDGRTDFPADHGCTGADDNDETDPCRAPAAGERVSLAGCGTGDVIVLRGVNFEFDRARLTVNAKTILEDVAAELKAYPRIDVEISGHTDARGSDVYNQRLSESRARTVQEYLVSSGVASGRMTVVGYGETQPVSDNESDEGRELNRRVELKIVSGGGAEPDNADTERDPRSTLTP